MKEISSLIFLTNALHGIIRGAYMYSTVFIALTISSVILHATNNRYTTIFWIDQIAILSVFLVGFHYLFRINNILKILAVITFTCVIIMYYYGYLTESLCFDNTYGNMYHSCIHLIGSIGHHCIMLGL